MDELSVDRHKAESLLIEYGSVRKALNTLQGD